MNEMNNELMKSKINGAKLRMKRQIKKCRNINPASEGELRSESNP